VVLCNTPLCACNHWFARSIAEVISSFREGSFGRAWSGAALRLGVDVGKEEAWVSGRLGMVKRCMMSISLDTAIISGVVGVQWNSGGWILIYTGRQRHNINK
jgi:hypothetical protein